MRGCSSHHAAVLPSVALQSNSGLSPAVRRSSSIYLGSRAVTVGVLHAVVVLGGRGTPTLQLSVGLVALGQSVDKLVAAHVHPEAEISDFRFQIRNIERQIYSTAGSD